MPNDLISLLYVSEATLCEPWGAEPVEGIVEVALERNAALDVTGALVFTGGHFAQVLEGTAANVEELMASIRRDKRHKAIAIVETKAIVRRLFADWSLAYTGSSSFVERHITPLIEGSPSNLERLNGHRLIELMREFASTSVAL